MDTRYLMYHYSGKPLKEKVALAECIEAVLGRDEIKSTGENPVISTSSPVTYTTMPTRPASMISEPPAPYGVQNE